MATQIGIYRQVAAIIKHRPPVSVSEETEIVSLLGLEYANAIAFCLEQGLWNFAMRSSALTPDVDVEPQFGYRWVYTKPSDFVRLNAISTNGYFNPTLHEYLDEASYWLADVNPLYVSYVSDGILYGNNLGNWTATFERAVCFDLALRVAPHLTAMDEQQLNLLRKASSEAMRNAISKDALNQPHRRMEPGRLVQSRGGARGGQTPWWR